METTCGLYLYSITSGKVLVCHATHASWKQWSIPKGLKDEKEEPLDTAIRELKEETGIEFKKLDIIALHTLPSVKYEKRNKVLDSFLVIADGGVEKLPLHCGTRVKNAFPEIDKWEWVKLDVLNKWVHESQQKNISMIRELTEALKP